MLYEQLQNLWKKNQNIQWSKGAGSGNLALDSKRTLFESSQSPFLVWSLPSNESIIIHSWTGAAWGDTGDLRSRPHGGGVFGIYTSSLSLSERSSQPISSSMTGNGVCVCVLSSQRQRLLGPQMTRAEIIHARLDLQVNLTFSPSPLHHCMSQTGKQIWRESDKRPPLCDWSDGYIV